MRRVVLVVSFESQNFTEMCSGSEAGLYLRLIDCVYHSTHALERPRAVAQLGVCREVLVSGFGSRG